MRILLTINNLLSQLKVVYIEKYLKNNHKYVFSKNKYQSFLILVFILIKLYVQDFIVEKLQVVTTVYKIRLK